LTKRYKRLPDWLYFFGALPLLSVLPRGIGYRLTQQLGRHFFRVHQANQRATWSNISLVLDDGIWSPSAKAEAAHRSFEVMAAGDLDAFYFSRWTPRSLPEFYSFQGLEQIDRAHAEGRGVVLFTGHFSSLCSALVAFALKGYPLNHLTPGFRHEDPSHPAFRAHARFKLRRMRRQIGRDLIHLDSDSGARTPLSAAQASFEALRLLGENELVSMAIDVPPQLTCGTAKVNFLGRPCRFEGGVVSLALQSEAAVLPYFVLRDRDRPWRQRLTVQPPVRLSGSLRTDLQRCVDRLEEMILAHPEQWRRWDSLSRFRDTQD
jgi:KDO2-lipid IV(A) lauroyltransferase